jgi:drug/metabolite transporter (DMT)-like permease
VTRRAWLVFIVTGILVASAPLFVALLAVWISPAERARGVGLLGLGAGFAGVVILLGLDVSGGGAALAGSAAVLVAALLYAVSAHTLGARFAGVSPVAVAGGVMACAALLTAVPAAATLPSKLPSAGSIAAVIGLGIGPTGVAFAGFAALTAQVGPQRASVVAYLAPAFAVVLGVVFRSEVLTWSTVLGLALILGGSWLAASSRGAAATRAAASEGTAAASG